MAKWKLSSEEQMNKHKEEKSSFKSVWDYDDNYVTPRALIEFRKKPIRFKRKNPASSN